MGYEMKRGSKPKFNELGSSPVKGKGDNLKRIMSEKKALAKKTGTFYAPGAEPKVKVPNVKGFNIEGSSKAGKLAKWVGKGSKFLGSKALGVVGMMMATSSKADQPKKGKGKIEYSGGKIDFTKKR